MGISRAIPACSVRFVTRRTDVDNCERPTSEAFASREQFQLWECSAIAARPLAVKHRSFAESCDTARSCAIAHRRRRRETAAPPLLAARERLREQRSSSSKREKITGEALAAFLSHILRAGIV